MSAIKEYYNEYIYSADYVENGELAPEEYMEYLPEFPEELKIGTLSLGSSGVMLRFSPVGFILSAEEIPTPIRPVTYAN